MWEFDYDEMDEILSHPEKYKLDNDMFPDPETFNQIMAEGSTGWDGSDDELAPYLDIGTNMSVEEQEEKSLG